MELSELCLDLFFHFLRWPVGVYDDPIVGPGEGEGSDIDLLKLGEGLEHLLLATVLGDAPVGLQRIYLEEERLSRLGQEDREEMMGEDVEGRGEVGGAHEVSDEYDMVV